MKLQVKDNKAKISLLYIHGYNSSSNSLNGILNLPLNFNLIYFDYPQDKIYNTIDLALEIDKFIKKIKGKVVVMGHSLGGAVMAHLKNKYKIKKYIFLSALSPILKDNRGIKFLSDNSKRKNTIKNILANSLKMVGYDKIAIFLKPTKQWSRFSNENILNIEYLDEDLRNAYISKANKSISIIGTKDHLFSYKKYNDFMNNINIKNYTIKNGGHNVMSDHPEETTKILNNEIKFKKRFRKKILKS